MNTKQCITRPRCGLNRALKLTVTPESAVTHTTSFPGPFPWLGGGAGKGPGIGWSRAHFTPWNPGQRQRYCCILPTGFANLCCFRVYHTPCLSRRTIIFCKINEFYGSWHLYISRFLFGHSTILSLHSCLWRTIHALILSRVEPLDRAIPNF